MKDLKTHEVKRFCELVGLAIAKGDEPKWGVLDLYTMHPWMDYAGKTAGNAGYEVAGHLLENCIYAYSRENYDDQCALLHSVRQMLEEFKGQPTPKPQRQAILANRSKFATIYATIKGIL